MGAGRAFPQGFSLKAMEGRRSADFADKKPEDGFQSLVGDWFLNVDPHASAPPTVGADGRIDVFLKSLPPQRPPLLLNAHAPLIIECKWHDSTASDCWANVKQGWHKVAQALRKAAEGGWIGRYEPWRSARGYLYCLSVTCPDAQSRLDLEKKIKGFFDGLPAAQRPPIEQVQVADWQNLRAEFDRDTLLADKWLGVGFDSILDHETYVSRLHGFRLYLKEDNLAFVAPDQTSDTHPDRLFEAVERRANNRGMLVVGPGGIGKTRIALEIATRASRAGWRVLHVVAGRSEVTAATLAESVPSGKQTRPILLVLDYLEQMAALNLDDLRLSVIDPVVGKGGRVCFLALSRPGMARVNERNWKVLFDRVDFVPQPEQRDRIVRAMVRSVAPRSCDRLGEDTMLTSVGNRPIIALLIAREIERRQSLAGGGAELGALLAGMRQGDLSAWLERRLQEDNLIPPPPARPTGLLPTREPPQPSVIAAAAVMAAAPLVEWKMEDIARAVLAEAAPNLVERAEELIAHLRDLGWLESDGDFVHVAHDVVTDEILTQCLVDPLSGNLRPRSLDLILSAGLVYLRVLGRHADALSRTFSAGEPELVTSLSAAIGRWLDTHSPLIAESFTAEPLDTVSYALGSMISAPLFQDGLVVLWDRLITPWLERNGSHREARHLIGRALKSTRTITASLSESAFVWLTNHGATAEASHVIAPLLAQGNMGKEAPSAIAAAFAWLKQADNGIAAEASHVLAPLLAREDLGEEAPSAIAAAFAWLKQADNGIAAEASHVLAPLLAREDLGEEAPRAIAAAFTWLEHLANGIAAEAQFVLAPLLAREDLGEEAPSAIAAAFAWLKQADNGIAAEAQFVLHPLLVREDLGEEAPSAIAAAFAWLKQADNGIAAEASHVLAPLLAREDLGEEAPSAIAAAFAWLKQADNGIAAEAQFVLHPLLAREDLGEEVPRAIAAAFTWLEQADNGIAAEASHVLPPLLARGDLGEEVPRAIAAAFAWLEQADNAISADASHVLKPLMLRLKSVDDGGRMTVTAHRLAFLWIESNWQAAGADFLLNRVLRQPILPDPAWCRVAARTLVRLRKGMREDEAYTLAALLTRPNRLRARTIYALLDRFLELNALGAAQGVYFSPPAMRVLSDRLGKMAMAASASPGQLPSLVLDFLDQTWNDSHAGGYGYLLAPLLPLAQRTADMRTASRAENAICRWLDVMRGNESARNGLARACIKLLEAGSWPDRELGRQVLERLGILRSNGLAEATAHL